MHTVGSDLDHHVRLDMIVHLAIAQIDRAAFALEIAPDATSAPIRADARHLDASGGREQIGHVIHILKST